MHLLKGQLKAGWSEMGSAGSPSWVSHDLSSSSRLAQFYSHGRDKGPRENQNKQGLLRTDTTAPTAMSWQEKVARTVLIQQLGKYIPPYDERSSEVH